MDARSKILETATRLFSTHGYESTSLSQVAKDAAVSKALVFWHFDNKDKLFEAVLARTIEPYSLDLETDLAGLDEPAQLEKLIDLYLEFVGENVYSVRFFLSLFLREEKRPDDLFGKVVDLYRLYRGSIGQIITRGQERGNLARTVCADAHAALILSALNGLLVQAFMSDPGAPEAEVVVAAIKSTLVRAISIR